MKTQKTFNAYSDFTTSGSPDDIASGFQEREEKVLSSRAQSTITFLRANRVLGGEFKGGGIFPHSASDYTLTPNDIKETSKDFYMPFNEEGGEIYESGKGLNPQGRRNYNLKRAKSYANYYLGEILKRQVNSAIHFGYNNTELELGTGVDGDNRYTEMEGYHLASLLKEYHTEFTSFSISESDFSEPRKDENLAKKMEKIAGLALALAKMVDLDSGSKNAHTETSREQLIHIALIRKDTNNEYSYLQFSEVIKLSIQNIYHLGLAFDSISKAHQPKSAAKLLYSQRQQKPSQIAFYGKTDHGSEPKMKQLNKIAPYCELLAKTIRESESAFYQDLTDQGSIISSNKIPRNSGELKQYAVQKLNRLLTKKLSEAQKTNNSSKQSAEILKKDKLSRLREEISGILPLFEAVDSSADKLEHKNHRILFNNVFGIQQSGTSERMPVRFDHNDYTGNGSDRGEAAAKKAEALTEIISQRKSPGTGSYAEVLSAKSQEIISEFKAASEDGDKGGETSSKTGGENGDGYRFPSLGEAFGFFTEKSQGAFEATSELFSNIWSAVNKAPNAPLGATTQPADNDSHSSTNLGQASNSQPPKKPTEDNKNDTKRAADKDFNNSNLDRRVDEAIQALASEIKKNEAMLRSGSTAENDKNNTQDPEKGPKKPTHTQITKPNTPHPQPPIITGSQKTTEILFKDLTTLESLGEATKRKVSFAGDASQDKILRIIQSHVSLIKQAISPENQAISSENNDSVSITFFEDPENQESIAAGSSSDSNLSSKSNSKDNREQNIKALEQLFSCTNPNAAIIIRRTPNAEKSEEAEKTIHLSSSPVLAKFIISAAAAIKEAIEEIDQTSPNQDASRTITTLINEVIGTKSNKQNQDQNQNQNTAEAAKKNFANLLDEVKSGLKRLKSENAAKKGAVGGNSAEKKYITTRENLRPLPPPRPEAAGAGSTSPRPAAAKTETTTTKEQLGQGRDNDSRDLGNILHCSPVISEGSDVGSDSGNQSEEANSALVDYGSSSKEPESEIPNLSAQSKSWGFFANITPTISTIGSSVFALFKKCLPFASKKNDEESEQGNGVSADLGFGSMNSGGGFDGSEQSMGNQTSPGGNNPSESSSPVAIEVSSKPDFTTQTGGGNSPTAIVASPGIPNPTTFHTSSQPIKQQSSGITKGEGGKL